MYLEINTYWVFIHLEGVVTKRTMTALGLLLFPDSSALQVTEISDQVWNV